MLTLCLLMAALAQDGTGDRARPEVPAAARAEHAPEERDAARQDEDGADEGAAVVRSAHEAHMLELERRPLPITEDQLEAARIELAARGRRASSSTPPVQSLGVAPERTIRDDAIVFGYLQSESQVFHLRWHALTHVASRFVNFDAAGNLTNLSAFTNRSSYLKAGGAAEAAGVKVVLTLANFDDGPGGDIESVMTSPARRSNLASQLAGVMANDPYAHGVSLDLEFLWGSTVRDGITAFCAELRAALDAVRPGLELSVYVGAIHSGSQWDFDAQTGLTPNVDYVLYSMYDWASGSTARAISDYNNCIANGRMYDYFEDGLPPEKMVPIISAYSRRWNNVSSYGASGSSPSSGGFTDGHFDTTLNPNLGPGSYRYVRGDEAAWYTYSSGGTQRVRTFDSIEAMQVEVMNAVAADDPSGQFAGRRLGGVGFWSLMWMAEFSSVDPRTGASVSRTRTYPHVYQLVHDAFARPGEARRDLETFAGLDFRWRDPNESPDTVGDSNADSRRDMTTSAPTPGGRGLGMAFVFDMEGSQSNRAVLAHEVLAHPSFPTLRDTNSALGHVPLDTVLTLTARNEIAAQGYAARMIVIDALGQLEAGPSVDLGAVGDVTLDWRLADPTAATAFVTQEPGFASGNGVVETDGGADIAVFGVVVEGDGPAVGRLVLDDIHYREGRPIGGTLRINELRTEGAGLEFVEIVGPAGALPFGLSVRTIDADDGSVARSFPLFGSIPNDIAGRGFLVAGDSGVPGVDSTAGFGTSSDDLADEAPWAVQLYDAVNERVLDSVLYGGFAGPDELVRVQTGGAARYGPPWVGRIGTGRDGSGALIAHGRAPDGRGVGVNGLDFGAAPATPGAPNGAGIELPARFDFEAPIPELLQTFDVVRRVPPGLSSLPASPSGGLTWRVVDVSGGGVIGFLGDGSLGRRRGIRARAEVYAHGPLDPAQAVGLGVGPGTGSTFFTAAPATSGYESGLWLIRENRSGVNLADGRPDHPGVWELVVATHDNGDPAPVDLLASATDNTLGVNPGSWAEVEIVLRPEGAIGPDLEVRVNGATLYSGALPAGTPRRGAFQVGFRENHPGGPTVIEGAWIDGVELDAAVPAIDPGSLPK